MIQTLIARALPLALILAAAPMAGADVGLPLPTPEFDGLKQTTAESFEDFTGRVVLVEFFEHW